jgi:hypothetical protein
MPYVFWTKLQNVMTPHLQTSERKNVLLHQIECRRRTLRTEKQEQATGQTVSARPEETIQPS